MNDSPKTNIHELKSVRKMLRNNATPWEIKLWQHLKGRQLYGFKFRRQTSIHNYIVDFICIELKLIIELDGSGHLHKSQIEKDKIRQEELESWGFKVIRFNNNEIDINLEGVLEQISEKSKHLSTLKNQ